jgi:hypothetical protein
MVKCILPLIVENESEPTSIISLSRDQRSRKQITDSMRRFIFIFIACYSGTSDAFTTQQNAIGLRSLISNNQDSHDVTGSNYATCTCPSRRSIVTGPVVASLLTLIANDKAQAADGSLNVLVGQLKESSKMMDVIPDLIKAEKWDAGELLEGIQYFNYHTLTTAVIIK